MPMSVTPRIPWNNRPFTLIAKVDAVINPSDTLLWDYEFTHLMVPDEWGYEFIVNFDGVSNEIIQGYQSLYDGQWSITAESGVLGAEPSIELFYTDENGHPQSAPFLTLTTLNETHEIIIPQGSTAYIKIRQAGDLSIATIKIRHTASFNTQGELPRVSTAGDQFTVHYDYSPRPGVLTARAKIYDATGIVQTVSDDITLTISGSNGGGC